jgi:hypothetical protein
MRTIYKPFTPFSEVFTFTDEKQAATCKTVDEAKQFMKVDWDKLGSVFAMGERSMMFFENEAEQQLKREGLLDLTAEENDKFFKLIIGERWMKKKMAEIQAQENGKPVEEIIEKKITAIEETTKKAVPEWHQKAREWEPEAVTSFHTGVAKGSAEFLDKDGKLKGERKIKLKNTYEILLICWPEIEEMIKTKKRMEDLWNWLVPFSHPYWIEIQDLDQLVSLARSIKLKLKKAGRPPKPRKC